MGAWPDVSGLHRGPGWAYFRGVKMRLMAATVHGLGWALAVGGQTALPARPHVVLVLADQWRAEAFGYAGNPEVQTPHVDRLQRESCHFVNAVAGVPVCCPTRASLLSGQRALTHGVFLNDVPLAPAAATLGKVFRNGGYATAYIGKWHVDGHGRSNFIPRERRQGFDYWKVLECTHNYNHSQYYGDEPAPQVWDGYDAIAQTRDAQQYLRNRAASAQPFFLFLSWGPPHDPYQTAPQKYRAMYQAEKLTLRPNVPPRVWAESRRDLAGYYAHCTALDECLGNLRQTLQETGLATNTVLVFTSDHGDLLGAHGFGKKQQPYDESVRIPALFHWPAGLGKQARQFAAPLNSEDFLPTLAGLCRLPIPQSVEGLDYSGYLRGGPDPSDGATLLACPAPFGLWARRVGGKEYRGVRTARHTYVRDLNGPWLLFDNVQDPWQTNNLIGLAEAVKLQADLEAVLQRKLRQARDEFLPAEAYIKKWGYMVDATGTVPYTP